MIDSENRGATGSDWSRYLASTPDIDTIAKNYLTSEYNGWPTVDAREDDGGDQALAPLAAAALWALGGTGVVGSGAYLTKLGLTGPSLKKDLLLPDGDPLAGAVTSGALRDVLGDQQLEHTFEWEDSFATHGLPHETHYIVTEGSDEPGSSRLVSGKFSGSSPGSTWMGRLFSAPSIGSRDHIDPQKVGQYITVSPGSPLFAAMIGQRMYWDDDLGDFVTESKYTYDSIGNRLPRMSSPGSNTGYELYHNGSDDYQLRSISPDLLEVRQKYVEARERQYVRPLKEMELFNVYADSEKNARSRYGGPHGLDELGYLANWARFWRTEAARGGSVDELYKKKYAKGATDGTGRYMSEVEFMNQYNRARKKRAYYANRLGDKMVQKSEDAVIRRAMENPGQTWANEIIDAKNDPVKQRKLANAQLRESALRYYINELSEYERIKGARNMATWDTLTEEKKNRLRVRFKNTSLRWLMATAEDMRTLTQDEASKLSAFKPRSNRPNLAGLGITN